MTETSGKAPDGLSLNLEMFHRLKLMNYQRVSRSEQHLSDSEEIVISPQRPVHQA